jgi:hypothetical protein
VTDPIVTVGPDGRAYVTVVEHERLRRKKEIFQSALVDMARRMNQMAAEIEREQPQPWTEPTAPAPLGKD